MLTTEKKGRTLDLMKAKCDLTIKRKRRHQDTFGPGSAHPVDLVFRDIDNPTGQPDNKRVLTEQEQRRPVYQSPFKRSEP